MTLVAIKEGVQGKYVVHILLRPQAIAKRRSIEARVCMEDNRCSAEAKRSQQFFEHQ
jgi:hypothetical protein